MEHGDGVPHRRRLTARAPLLVPLGLTCALAVLPLVAVELIPALDVVLGSATYLVFHNIAEFFGVMVALSVFGVGWYTHDQSRDRHALFLASAFLAVGLVQFMHALSYAGMPDFVTPSSPNKASQLWLVARACTAAAFLASAFVRPGAETPWLSKPVLGGLAVAVSLATFLAAVVFPGTLPAAFVPGAGQTLFKRLAEYGLVATFVAAIAAHTWRFARRPDPAAALYVAGFAANAFAELCFAAYRSVTDTRNALGHLYTVVGFFLVYRAVFIESVQRPHRALLEAAAALRLERDERAAAQEALARALEDGRREHDRVSAIMEASPVALVRVEADGRVGYLNAEAERVLGVLRADVAGRSFDAPEWQIRDEAGALMASGDLPFSVIVRTRAPVRMRHAVQDPAGHTKLLDITGAPLLDSRGAFEGAVFGLEDATARARMEDQLRQSQKMEAVGRLAGGVAHDFNNVLTAVLSAADYLLRELPQSSPLREEAEEIRVGGRKAAALTRQLLTFSRKQVIVPRLLSLDGVLSELIPLLRRLIGEDVELAWKAPPGLGSVRADPGQIEQVIVNLVVNARDAVSSGGRIAVTLEDVEIGDGEARDQVGVRPGRFVCLSVADDGCGMTKEVLAHAFEPFFTTKAPGKGTGLGLSTIYGIVRQCGGHVRVQSQPGTGSEFRIYLPRAEGAAASTDEPVDRPRAQAVVATASILLAEDDPQVRAVAARALRRAGHVVVESTDGDEAVEWASDPLRPLDVLVTDLIMPRLGGQDLAARVRAARPGVKVLFISGYSGEDFDAGQLGPEVSFLPKPFTPAALVEEVQALLEAGIREQAAGA